VVEETVIASVTKYLALLKSFGIYASKAVLFGSFARGEGNEYSDIDLIVIAPQFDGSRDISMVKSLWHATATDCRIEPIPCGEKEWETDQSRPILEIARREGIIVAA
jgi:predicted nucleotidyltransferase